MLCLGSPHHTRKSVDGEDDKAYMIGWWIMCFHGRSPIIRRSI